jgi:hypothetical protein
MFDVFLHFSRGVVAEPGMDMTIGCYINQGRHVAEAGKGYNQDRGKKGEGWNSSIPFREEMEDAIDIGGVADVAHFHIEIDKGAYFIHLHRKGRAIRQMIDQGIDFAQVNGIGKDFFHVGSLHPV